MTDLSAFPVSLAVPCAVLALFLVLSGLQDVRRRRRPDLAPPRLQLYAQTMAILWGLAAVCLAGWLLSGRSLAELGLGWTAPGWRGGAAWACAAAGVVYALYAVLQPALSRAARQEIRRAFASGDMDFIRPRTRAEFGRFRALSITAGVTEEIIFRGFLIGVLALAMPFALAALASSALFGLAHVYQGPAGMARAGLIGGLMAAIYVLGGSLWPAIVLHALIDLAAGGAFEVIAAFEDKDAEEAEDVQDADKPAQA